MPFRGEEQCKRDMEITRAMALSSIKIAFIKHNRQKLKMALEETSTQHPTSFPSTNPTSPSTSFNFTKLPSEIRDLIIQQVLNSHSKYEWATPKILEVLAMNDALEAEYKRASTRYLERGSPVALNLTTVSDFNRLSLAEVRQIRSLKIEVECRTHNWLRSGIKLKFANNLEVLMVEWYDCGPTSPCRSSYSHDSSADVAYYEKVPFEFLRAVIRASGVGIKKLVLPENRKMVRENGDQLVIAEEFMKFEKEVCPGRY